MSAPGQQSLGMAANDLLRTLRAATARPAVEEVEIPIDRIEPNPYQPRRSFDDGKLRDLAESLGSAGQLQPVVVRAHPTRAGHYQLVAGERRWRAARFAGLATVQGVRRHDVDDTQLMLLAYHENSQREELTPLEEAAAFDRMMRHHAWTITELARRVGKNRIYVGERLALLTDDAIQAALQDGLLTFTLAREALRVLDAGQRRQLVDDARRGLAITVEHIRQRAGKPAPATTPPATPRHAPAVPAPPPPWAEPAGASSPALADAATAPTLIGPAGAVEPTMSVESTAVDSSADSGQATPPGAATALPTAPAPWLHGRAADLPSVEAAANRRTDYLLQDALGLVEQLQSLGERARRLPAIFGPAPSAADRAIRDQAIQIMSQAAAEAYALAVEWDKGHATAPD